MNRNPDAVGIKDCDACRRMTQTIIRQSMGCPYEAPAPPTVPVITWSPGGWRHDPPAFCAGYTTRMPAVEEASRLRLHWKTAALGIVLRGEELTEQSQIAIELLDAEVGSLERWLMTPKEKGGGAE